MKLVTRAMLLAGLLAALTATAAFAEEPVPVDGFVCPVLGGQAGEGQGNSSPEPIVGIAGGAPTVLGPDVTVPTHATNNDGGGVPSDEESFASPGDPDYTAIWGTTGPSGRPGG